MLFNNVTPLVQFYPLRFDMRNRNRIVPCRRIGLCTVIRSVYRNHLTFRNRRQDIRIVDHHINDVILLPFAGNQAGRSVFVLLDKMHLAGEPDFGSFPGARIPCRTDIINLRIRPSFLYGTVTNLNRHSHFILRYIFVIDNNRSCTGLLGDNDDSLHRCPRSHQSLFCRYSSGKAHHRCTC